MNENILIAILAELKRIADANEIIATATVERNVLMQEDIMAIRELQDSELLASMFTDGDSH